jgi:hypothetical protein
LPQGTFYTFAPDERLHVAQVAARSSKQRKIRAAGVVVDASLEHMQEIRLTLLHSLADGVLSLVQSRPTAQEAVQ